MNSYVFYAVAIGVLTFAGAGLAGQLAAKERWHKWFFWGAGLVVIVLIYLQARAYKEPPTAAEIATEVRKQFARDVKPIEGAPAASPPVSQGKVAHKKSNASPIKSPETSMPTTALPTTQPSAVTIAHLNISQSVKPSTNPDASFETEVVVQTDTVFPSLRFAIQCDKPIVSGTVMNSGVRMMTNSGVVKEHPNVFVYSYGSATPPFGPANPLIIDLWSKEPITCKEAATF
jgi:hypothetical protein